MRVAHETSLSTLGVVRGSPCQQDSVKEEDEEEFLLRAGRQRWSTVPGLQTGAELWSRLLPAIKTQTPSPLSSKDTQAQW